MVSLRSQEKSIYAGSVSQQRSASVSAMPGRTDHDASLMQAIIERADKAALADIAGHYAPRLKAFLMSRGEQAQTAEDIVQDVIILVWTKARQFDPAKGTLSAWIYRMTRNKWIDHKRKHDRLQPTAPDILSTLVKDVVDAADVDYDRAQAAGAVRDKLASLPETQKQLLHMSFYEGLSHSQIAERTGVPLGTIKGRIRAALKQMRLGLEDYSEVENHYDD